MGVLLLARSNTRFYGNRFLAALLFFFVYRLVAEILGVLGYISVDSILYHVFVEFNWFYGGLLFFYVVCYLNPSRRFFKRDAVHLIPPALEFVISNFVKTQNFYWDGTPESLSWFGTQAYVLWNHTPFQILVFGGLILYYGWQAKDYVEIVSDAGDVKTNNTTTKKYTWLRRLLWAYLLFALGAIVSSCIDYWFFNFAFQPFYIYPLYVGIALLTYSVGLLGFLHRNDPVRHSTRIDIDGLIDVDEKVAALKEAMQTHQLFKNPRLSLDDLADAIEVKPYVLTQLLNTSVGKNFNDYVNEFRVEEVVRLMKDASFDHYTLTAIGFEAGFNSKATFNRIFRKVTGKTPGEVKTEGP